MFACALRATVYSNAQYAKVYRSNFLRTPRKFHITCRCECILRRPKAKIPSSETKVTYLLKLNFDVPLFYPLLILLVDYGNGALKIEVLDI